MLPSDSDISRKLITYRLLSLPHCTDIFSENYHACIVTAWLLTALVFWFYTEIKKKEPYDLNQHIPWHSLTNRTQSIFSYTSVVLAYVLRVTENLFILFPWTVNKKKCPHSIPCVLVYCLHKNRLFDMRAQLQVVMNIEQYVCACDCPRENSSLNCHNVLKEKHITRLPTTSSGEQI